MIFSRVSCVILKNTIRLQTNFFSRQFSCTNCHKMRFVQYQDGGDQGLGVQLNDGGPIVSLNRADQCIPVDMVSFLNSEYSIEKIKQ